MRNNKNRYYIFLTSVLILILIIGVLYNVGFRLTDNFMIGKVGYLNINTPLENTSIIIDKETKILSTKESEKVELSPKTHEIIISKEGYFPWTKKVKIPSGDVLKIHPIFISQNASGQIITQNDGEFWKIKNLVEKSVLPNTDKPITSTDGRTLVWVENNAILAKTGNEIRTVIQPETPIKNLSFYKDRNDVLIFSTSNSIYTIETDTTNIQNFFPVYKGTDPKFVVATTTSLYVLDGNLLMEVII